MKGDRIPEYKKIYHVTNTSLCDGAFVPRDSIKRVSAPPTHDAIYAESYYNKLY